MPSFAKTVVVDTGFWYALYDAGDQYHAQAEEKDHLLQTANVLLPWPCLYETFNTRFARNKMAVTRFGVLVRQAHVVLLRDEPYREFALEAAISTALIGRRHIALVDMVIRLILEDVNVRKHGLLTFNPRDFSDVCRKHQIEML